MPGARACWCAATAVVSALLFVAFIIGISSAWARGLSIDCGCFGGGGEIPDAAAKYPGEIARDVGLLALSLWLVVRPASRLALDNVLFRSTPTRPPTTPPTTTTTKEASMAQKKTSHRTAEEKAATAAKREARRARTERARGRGRGAPQGRPSARSSSPASA